jgi:hypothetical protein
MNSFAIRQARRLLLGAGLLLATSAANAQATRTWVSGVGDDVNPCSRTAPCKTWAGAISKTASGGIIDALDPGGFGALTITKPITVEGNGTLASTLHSAVSGFIVNITTGTAGTKNVVLRNILIDGSGPTLGTNGIRFLAGDSLLVEHCSIEQVSGNGIDFQSNSTARLIVRNTTITQATGAGINVAPAVGGVARVSISDTLLARNGTNILVTDVNGASNVSVVDSHVVHAITDGIFANSTTGNGMTIMVEDSEVSHNGAIGLRTSGANSRIRAANNLISGNTTGVSAPSGELCTYQNNRLARNNADGAFSGTCVPSNQ